MQLVTPSLGLILGLILICLIIYGLVKLFSSKNTLLTILLIVGGLIIIPVILENSKSSFFNSGERSLYINKKKKCKKQKCSNWKGGKCQCGK